MSTVKSLYHIVINTKRREMTIPEGNKRQLYAYLYGIVKNCGCTLLRMNGIPNHVHMLIDLSPQIALSTFMHNLKRSSSLWMKTHPDLFPHFQGWGKEYYAFSCSEGNKDAIIEYIKGQEAHHSIVDYVDEMKEMATGNGCDYHVHD